MHLRLFFPLHAQCSQHNADIYNNTHTEKTVINTHDIVTGSPQKCDQIKYLTLVQNCDKYDDHKGLIHKLYVVVDLIFNLTTDIKTGRWTYKWCFMYYKRYLIVLANITIIFQLYNVFYFIIQILVGKGDIITGTYMYL